jgi:hypothetical protein
MKPTTRKTRTPVTRHYTCQQMRRRLVTSGTMDMVTGAFTLGPSEWQAAPCNTPLFGDYQIGGVCKSCREGWEAAGSQIIDPVLPLTWSEVPRG